MGQKEFFINSIELIDVQGGTNIPTVLLYRDGKAPAFGAEALSQAEDRGEVNEDFKVDLGNQKPGAASQRRFSSGDGKLRSAGELTADFIHEIIANVSSWLASRDVTRGANILVAEPLAMQEDLVSDAWLANYRNYLRRILSGKGFANVEFLPEPFAVYQYYRYGEKHPIVAERRKHHALVLDFGGGTFDVCLIATTKEGDISQGGRMARPLSASSNPVGGFFINRVIAEELIRKVLAPRNIGSKISKGFDLYKKYRRDSLDLASLSPEYQNFIRNFQRLAYRVEDAKLTLCRLIRDWSLDGALTLSVPVATPQDPFVEHPTAVNVQFSAAELRSAFVSKVWDPHLKPLIRLALQRGKEELSGAPVTVVLLSGGSANIRWIVQLLRKDFATDLQAAEILQLKDFQEVVAKGLAVECARRYYTPERQGDFSKITYNRLCLILDPDDTGHELKKYIPRDPALPKLDIAGVLLPSASVLTQFKDRPMRWRVHLDSAPRRCLNYYFLRSSFNPEDLPNLQNVEEHVVYSPKASRFDPDLTLELQVAEDGTATPNFIYKSGRSEAESVAQKGRPFFLDMTTGDSGATVGTAYIGLDFGTSNTSVSFVNETSIQVFERRSQERSWNELSDLLSSLPYPVAAPLANYLCQTDPVRLATTAREFVEAALTLAAYTTYAEFCSLKGRAETKLFKALTKRSAGPVWKLFREAMQQIGGHAALSSAYNELLEPELYKEINDAVDVVALHKHGKASEESAQVLRPVQILANITSRVFADNAFGMFQHVQKQRFSAQYEGSFRHAHGRPPFIAVSHYIGATAFSNNEAFIVNQQSSKAMPLEPLILWEQCNNHLDLENGHCYLFDTAERDGSFTYKATGYPCVLTVSPNGAYSELAKRLQAMMEHDMRIEPLTASLSPAP